ncbi:MAG: cytochrome c [Deltaproteobacteria bacterium]|nr:cytochrome c [Deltaproteobacteria bacterium]MBT7202567.1 cytochrome c [Deltaproteobacteria bacterium]
MAEPPEMMQDHMLENMQDHLLALTEIQQHLALEEYEKASTVAENRLGMSSLSGHGASHMVRFMPTALQQIGTQMHKAASRFATIVQEGGLEESTPKIAEGLAGVMQQCVACHSSYRVHP